MASTWIVLAPGIRNDIRHSWSTPPLLGLASSRWTSSSAAESSNTRASGRVTCFSRKRRRSGGRSRCWLWMTIFMPRRWTRRPPRRVSGYTHRVTDRLYLADSALLDFDATVVAVRDRGGRPAVVLDRTAFYPEGGGQPADRG